MNKKLFGSFGALVMAGTLVLSGCGNNAASPAAKVEETPKALLKASVASAMTATSYQMDSNFTLNELTVAVPPSSADTASVDQVVSMLKGAEFNVKTVYQGEPMQAEMNLEVKLKGDMEMTIKLPIVMTKEKMYVKVPNIALLPLPENLVGKFIEIDMKELAAEQGTEFNEAMLDPKNSQKLSADVSAAVLDSFDEAKYFKKVAVGEAGLPEGVTAEDVVRFEVTNDNVKDAITTLVNVVLPKVIDTINTPEYREMTGVTEQELNDAKKRTEHQRQRGNEQKPGRTEKLPDGQHVPTGHGAERGQVPGSPKNDDGHQLPGYRVEHVGQSLHDRFVDVQQSKRKADV